MIGTLCMLRGSSGSIPSVVGLSSGEVPNGSDWGWWCSLSLRCSFLAPTPQNVRCSSCGLPAKGYALACGRFSLAAAAVVGRRKAHSGCAVRLTFLHQAMDFPSESRSPAAHAKPCRCLSSRGFISAGARPELSPAAGLQGCARSSRERKDEGESSSGRTQSALQAIGLKSWAASWEEHIPERPVS